MARKLYIDNLILKQNFKSVKKEEEYLKLGKKKMLAIANSYPKHKGECEKKRRNRRNADEINRLYRCEITGCDKSYGSEGTLAQHYRTKHPKIPY